MSGFRMGPNGRAQIVPAPTGWNRSSVDLDCQERKRIMNCDCVCHDISGGSHSEKDCWCAS
jgi:hypothetical protein